MNSFIETLNLWGGDFSGFAWPMLWQSSLLITALAVFDFLCRRKIRAAIRYALWLVVLVKLCLPPALALPTGVGWWLFPSKTTAKAPVTTKYVVTYDTTAPTDSIQPIIPVLAPPPPKLDAAGWTLLGCGFMSTALLLWLAMRWWQISRKVSGATESAELAGLLEEIRGRAGLRSSLRLKLVDGQMSPAVCGLIRPVILLPRVLVEQLSAAQLRAVLLHEAFHLRRKDVWINCAQALLQIAYWWHPLLWLANARIRRLREEAVDDAVMLGLSSEAESYAPTLLAVAKLAFSRPLMSLGLVGIMESRSALRKRIERLVNFPAPRKAGLTFLSLGGIFVFSAVAVPMGEAPASAPDTFPQDAASAETTLTAKVNPDRFIRNVKAHADWTIQTGTNDYTDILLDTLRSEGVNCNPPHGIAFNTKTGEMTMQNTPEQLEVFRRVVEQLNRADGICELPLHTNFLRKSVLIEARLYQMPAADFKSIASDLQFYPASHVSDEWWSAAPEKFKPLLGNLESSGRRPILRPRIQTGSGMPAEMHIGNISNSVDIACKPYAGDGFVDLRIRGSIIANATASDPFTNHFSVEASAQSGGGILIRVEHFDGYADSNLIAVINMEVVTNAPPAHFQERLQKIISRPNGTATGQQVSAQTQSFPGQVPTGTSSTFVERLKTIMVRQTNGATVPLSEETRTVPDQTGNSAPQIFVSTTNAPHSSPADAQSASDLVREAKVLYEMGKLDEAKNKLQSAIALNPDNAAAHYYLNLVQAAKGAPGTGMLQTQSRRKAIVDKLNRIHFDSVSFDYLPLSEVIRQLSEQTRLRDPEKKGINFLINPNPDTPGSINPTTGLPEAMIPAAAAATPLDQVVINLNLTDVRMTDLLDAIVKGADHPIKYSIVDYGVEFSSKEQSSTTLFTRTFRIDPDTLFAGLRRQTQFTGTDAQDGVTALKKLFSDAGVDLQPTNKAIFYNDRLGLIFVRATANDLDTIESIIARLNTPPTQIHIKARFMEVPKGTLDGFGFSKMIASTNLSEQLVGILTSENEKVAMKALESRAGVEELAEPEAVTLSGRQTQMRATTIMNIVTNFAYQETWTNGDSVILTNSIIAQTSSLETGPVLDSVATVLPDGYTIDLKITASVTEFLGYDQPPTNAVGEATRNPDVHLPVVLPRFRVRQTSTHLRLWDNQTVVLGNLPASVLVGGNQVSPRPEDKDKAVIVFITVTLVDPAGNRVHTDDEMSFVKTGPPPQPY